MISRCVLHCLIKSIFWLLAAISCFYFKSSIESTSLSSYIFIDSFSIIYTSILAHAHLRLVISFINVPPTMSSILSCWWISRHWWTQILLLYKIRIITKGRRCTRSSLFRVFNLKSSVSPSPNILDGTLILSLLSNFLKKMHSSLCEWSSI